MKNRYWGILSVVLLFIIAPRTVMAQDKYAQSHLDSILRKIPKLKQDTALVKTYGDLVNAYLALKASNSATPTDTLIIRATFYAEKQMKLAQKLKWNNGKVYGYGSLGNIAEKQKNYDEARGLYRKGYDLSGNDFVKHKAANWLGKSFAEEAIEHIYTNSENAEWVIFNKTLKYFDDLHDKSQLFGIYSTIDYFYLIKGNKAKQLEYRLKELKTFKENDTTNLHITTIINVSSAYQGQNDLVSALDYILKAKKLVNKTTTQHTRYYLSQYIGILYFEMNDFEKAAQEFKSSLNITSSRHLTLVQLAEAYREMNKPELALAADNDALVYTDNDIIAKKPHAGFIVTNYYDIAEDYYLMKNYQAAFANIQKAKAIEADALKKHLIQKPDTSIIEGKVLLVMPDSALIKAGIDPADRFNRVEKIFKSYLKTVTKYKSLSGQLKTYQNLNLLYDKTGDKEKAYAAYKTYRQIADSLNKLNNVKEVNRRNQEYSYRLREDSISFKQQLARNQLQNQLALSAKQKQLEEANYKQSQSDLQVEQSKRRANEQQLKASRNEQALADKTVQLQKTEITSRRLQSRYFIGGILALLILSFFIATNYINQRKSNKIISAEKKRSDDLLLNILPSDVAEELKEKGSANARLFDEVTVLFTDFVSFTTVSEVLTPQQLVDELNVCFKAFDGIMGIHNIEKIKTIGDAYLAVSGLPHAHENHAANTIKAAQEIQQFMLARKKLMGDKTFGIRIGIHSSSVVAGIVGVKKFAYDIWGDTVNTAARMEQNSQAGKINISEKTYELVSDQFNFKYRGEIAAKNKGMMKMYFVESNPGS